MKRAIYAPEAWADIYAIARHIAEEGDLDAAYRFVDTIEEKARLLATHPDMGRLRPELAPRLRSFPVGPFVIFYRHEKRGVEVARVLRGSRDIPSPF